MNMPILNEFYVNFGNEGVLYGMFLMGLLFGLIVKMGTIQINLEVIIFFFYLPHYFYGKSFFFVIWCHYSILFIFNVVVNFINYFKKYY